MAYIAFVELQKLENSFPNTTRFLYLILQALESRSRSKYMGIIAVIGPTHFKLLNCIFLNEFDMLNTNMKVLLVANKFFSRHSIFVLHYFLMFVTVLYTNPHVFAY